MSRTYVRNVEFEPGRHFDLRHVFVDVVVVAALLPASTCKAESKIIQLKIGEMCWMYGRLLLYISSRIIS